VYERIANQLQVPGRILVLDPVPNGAVIDSQ
jgi:hypothetical protein